MMKELRKMVMLSWKQSVDSGLPKTNNLFISISLMFNGDTMVTPRV